MWAILYLVQCYALHRTDRNDTVIVIVKHRHYYLRQVNEVNGGDNVFVRCASVSVFVRSGPVGVKC